MSDSNTIADTLPPEETSTRVGRLDTIADVRKELGRLYRSARKAIGENIDPQSAAKLAYLLNCIGRSLEGEALEKRVEEIERALKDVK